MRVQSIKDRGRGAENAVVDFLQQAGFPMAERRRQAGAKDKGDISGTHPDLCWEVKAGRHLSVPAWMAESEAERQNAGAQHAFLVVQPPGLGAKRAEQWWVFMPASTYASLVSPGSWVPFPIPPWRSFEPKAWLQNCPVVRYIPRKGKLERTDPVVLCTLSELAALLHGAGYGRGVERFGEDRTEANQHSRWRLPGDRLGTSE